MDLLKGYTMNYKIKGQSLFQVLMLALGTLLLIGAISCKQSNNDSEQKGIELDLKSNLSELARYENLFIGQCQLMVMVQNSETVSVSLPKEAFDMMVAGDDQLKSLGNCSMGADQKEVCKLVGNEERELTEWFPKLMQAKVINADFDNSEKPECKNVLSDYRGEGLEGDNTRADLRLSPVKMVTMLLTSIGHPVDQTTKKENLNYTIYYGDTFPIVLKLTLDANYNLIVDKVEDRVVDDSDEETQLTENSKIPSAINVTGANMAKCVPVTNKDGEKMKDSKEQDILDCQDAVKALEVRFAIDDKFANVKVNSESLFY